MILLLPMAGEGARFKSAGYTQSKPCIPIDSIPMVIQAVRSLPKPLRIIFICRDFHIRDGIDTMIKQFYPNAEFVVIDKLTQGQADTCLRAQKKIDPNDALLIGACDNGMLYQSEAFHTLSRTADCIVWTFRNNAAVVEHPEQYGWMAVDETRRVQRTSIKKALSRTPKKDHAVVGTFWFAKGHFFTQAVTQMMRNNDRINGEFYVDKCIDYCLESGLDVRIFEIDHYIGWGTPHDLETWTYWQTFFKTKR